MLIWNLLAEIYVNHGFLDIIKLLKITTPADLSQDGKKYVIFCVLRSYKQIPPYVPQSPCERHLPLSQGCFPATFQLLLNLSTFHMQIRPSHTLSLWLGVQT